MCSKTQNAGARDATTWLDSSPRRSARPSRPGSTSRRSSAPMMSNAQLSEATHEAVARAGRAQRADPVRVAEGDDRALRHHDRRVGALEPRHDGGDRVLDRLARGASESGAAMISESEVPRKVDARARGARCGARPRWSGCRCGRARPRGRRRARPAACSPRRRRRSSSSGRGRSPCRRRAPAASPRRRPGRRGRGRAAW